MASMELTVDRQEFLRALSTLEFSSYNTASQSIRLEVLNPTKGVLYSCSGRFATRAYFSIKSTDGEIPEENAVIILGTGVENFVSTLPSEELKIQYLEKNLRIRGMWLDSGKENFTDQKYPFLTVKVPAIEKLLKDTQDLGEIHADVLVEGVKYIKSFSNKEIFSPRVLVSGDKLIYMDEIKIGVFESSQGFPALSFGMDDMAPILSFLTQYKGQKIKALQFGNGYALESENGSVLVYAFNVKAQKELEEELSLEDEPPITFNIENKKFSNILQLLKTKGSQLFDEMDITIHPEGFLEMVRPPNFQSRLSVSPQDMPEEALTVKVQFSNLISVLRAFPKDTILMGINPEDKKFKIIGSLDISLGEPEEGEEEEKVSCRVMNILSYWNE